MRKVYHFRVVQIALLLLVAAPLFVAIGIGLVVREPGNVFFWILTLLALLFFGGGFVLGLLMLPRLMRNSEALILTPRSLTIRQVRSAEEIVLPWTEITGFTEQYIKSEHFITVHLQQAAPVIARERNRLVKWMLMMNIRFTGSPYSIGTKTIRCKPDELVQTLVEYLETYGLQEPAQAQ